MKRTHWLLAALLGTSPAAAWDLTSVETKRTWNYAGFQVDKCGTFELQFYRDEPILTTSNFWSSPIRMRRKLMMNCPASP